MNAFSLVVCSSLLLMSCNHKNMPLEAEKNVPTEQQMVGAYTQGRSVSEEELKLFKDTYKGDVELTPVSVATQVVAGTNYRFTCKNKQGNQYRVVIYQKLPAYGGESEVTSVEKL